MRNEFAEYIASLYYYRKQDGIIFVGSKAHKKLLKDLQNLEKDIFRSDCPIFLPVEYSDTVTLTLDSNLVFYENVGDESYNLTDRFSVRGGPATTTSPTAGARSPSSVCSRLTTGWVRTSWLVLTSLGVLWSVSSTASGGQM